MNIEYVGFPSLGFQGKNLCVMFVFAIVSFLFFYEYLFIYSRYCTRLEFTFGIRALLASGGCLCGQGFGSGL
jgi:hypothetical protein